jgi:hypothetical protein
MGIIENPWNQPIPRVLFCFNIKFVFKKPIKNQQVLIFDVFFAVLHITYQKAIIPFLFRNLF